MRIREYLFRALFLVSLIISISMPENMVNATSSCTNSGKEQAQSLLGEMTPEEKVGQLFLVTFSGTNIDTNTPIYQLITNHHIGGVILSRTNGNILSQGEIIESTWGLINELQKAEYYYSHPEQDILSETSSPAYIPLFVGLSQEGDNSFHTQILGEVSPSPSQMAIGATWDPGLAKEVGSVVGRELSLLGVNLLIGPSLDVLENPKPGEPSDLGVRIFGGDPYWVGRMGQAYIEGIHDGSQNKMLAIGKYFPGLGSADRLPEEEIATVRKSLEQLKQIELAPFFAVTGNAPIPEATVDGLLTSHIRYQGLQGNIRSTTRPISLDPQAFKLLMELEPLGIWRQNGGLMISDSLGSQALRYFYDPGGNTFNARQVALEAFFAGNDILYLDNFIDNNLPDAYTTIINTLDSFAQKYKEDQTFAERVDESVLRILTKKIAMYKYLDLTQVMTSQAPLSAFAEQSQIASDVARQGVTLISPDISELNNTLPNSPALHDSIVIITDSFKNEHNGESSLDKYALQESILRLYGPQSGLQFTAGNIISHTYEDIIQLLDFPVNAESIENNLLRADWIVVAALNTTRDRPSSLALQRLLSERQDLTRDKNVVVFAFNAPYYLDATNISKINAYYGLYSKLPSFVDVASRILFKEISIPSGSLPVSVPGIGYDLISATSPDPQQIFSLYLGEAPPEEEGPVQDQPSETPTFPVYNVGDVIDFQTGVILDFNGHPVPDGTPVQFVASTQGEANYLPLTITKNGQAEITLLIEQSADIQIYAISSLAESEILQIKVAAPELSGANEDVSQPIPPPTNTPNPTITPEVKKTITTIRLPKNLVKPWLSWQIWGLSFLITLALALIAYQIGATVGQVRWGIRWGFSTFMGGLMIYNYLALELPGSAWLASSNSPLWNVVLAVLVGSVLGWGIAFVIKQLQN